MTGAELGAHMESEKYNLMQPGSSKKTIESSMQYLRIIAFPFKFGTF